MRISPLIEVVHETGKGVAGGTVAGQRPQGGDIGAQLREILRVAPQVFMQGGDHRREPGGPHPAIRSPGQQAASLTEKLGDEKKHRLIAAKAQDLE